VRPDNYTRRALALLAMAPVFVATACAPARGGSGAPAAPGATGGASDIAVMSFNIRYGTANDGADHWSGRREQLFRLLEREAPDILATQEALRFQLDEIRAALPRYGEAGVGRDDGRERGEYAAILFRADRFELLESGTFWFSDTPDVPGSMSWGNRITRICTWARLRDRTSGRALRVYNVHLDHESQPSRERSVALLLERLRAAGGRDPVIVAGDFNAGETNPAVAALRAAGFRDTWRELHAGDSVAGTFHAFRGDSTGEKIDYVWVTGGSGVASAAILRASEGGRYPSDHFPVVARVVLRGIP
jgi:endonuclease/exonuclease/phosphatase family metal-dependent hydrolase